MPIELEFFGAAGEITGSCHIVRAGGYTVLLDCGMIQGSREDEARNQQEFPFDVESIDAVVLSHAHIDHSGRLPLLVKRGFNGPVYAQHATVDLCEVLLLDSAYLQQSMARREQITPLYSTDDARRTLTLLKGIRYQQASEILPGIELRFYDAGHIMGSAAVSLRFAVDGEQKHLVFSGDLGQYDTPVIKDPSAPNSADLVIMESTYGARRHRSRDATVAEFGEIISRANAERGCILMPAFAVGRSQEILYHLGRNYDAWGLADWHIFLDSPMAIEASQIYWSYPHLYDAETTRLDPKFNDMPELPNLHFTRSANESKVINKMESGAIVIAGSGMCTGGRILHHLKQRLDDPHTQVVFTGYQGRGTLGRRIIEGNEEIRIHGKPIEPKAKVHTLGGWSAHGDQADLLRWYRGFENRPPIYLVHGEPESGDALRAHFAKVTRDIHPAHSGLRVDL